MAAIAAPVPIRPATAGFFELPSRKRKQRRLIELERREQAALQEEASQRAQAWIYLNQFLQSSIWSDQLDQITIERDAVPTMPELNSYGDLDEKEGTRACRRLFKAVVIWDELGHSLWKTLRAASEERRLAQRQFEPSSPLDLGRQETCMSRRSYRCPSEDSNDSRRSRDSTRSTAATITATTPADKKQRLKLSKRLSSSRRSSSDTEMGLIHSTSASKCLRQLRRGTDPATPTTGRRVSENEPSRAALPRLISSNCASAVRRTLSAFGESRPSLSAGRSSR